MGKTIWGVHDFVQNYRVMTSAIPAPGQGGPSGCGFYRVIVPLAELAKHGWDTTWRAGVPPSDQVRDWRIIFAQRLDKPKALEIWRRMSIGHKRVYETDDDIFSVPDVRWLNASYPQAIMQDVVECAAQMSDMVTVSTEPLAEVYRDHGCKDVRVLPNCLPDAVVGLRRNRNRRKVVVGWQGGGSHGPDLEMISRPLRRAMQGHPNAELHLYGSDFSEITGPARFTDWTAADESLDYYRKIDFDIGLAR